MDNVSTLAPHPGAKQAAPRIRRTRIRGFDGLRAIAFLLVFVSHKVYFAHADSFGDVGVWLFFVLSGFLITRILAELRSEVEAGVATVPESLGRFYLRRTARIFPPYYLLLTSITVAALFVPIDYFGESERLAYYLYGTNVLIAARSQWIGNFGHFWTLAVEEQFYLAFAPLVLLVPPRQTLRVCLATVLTGVLTKVVLEATHASPVSIDVNSLINFALIGFGGAAGLKACWPFPKRFTGGAAQITVLGLYLALPAAFGTWPYLWPLLGKLSAALVGVLLLQIFQDQQSWFVRLLESAPLRSVGRMSYGAYLIHKFVHFRLIEALLQHIGGVPAPPFVQVLCELAASLVLAGLSWRYLEQPIIAWAARATSRASVASRVPANAGPAKIP
jgi:peptidoglycan/LPS O-acetylase OafA/YrhL